MTAEKPPIELTDAEGAYLTEARLASESTRGEYPLMVGGVDVGVMRLPRTIKAACNPAIRVTAGEFVARDPSFTVNGDNDEPFSPTHVFIVQDLSDDSVTIQFSRTTPEAVDG